MKSARLRETTVFDVPSRKNFLKRYRGTNLQPKKRLWEFKHRGFQYKKRIGDLERHQLEEDKQISSWPRRVFRLGEGQQPLEFRPVPLPSGEEGEYVLALKQELRGAMRQLPYFIRPAVPKRDVEPYSDKYQMSGPIDNAIDWNPDWRRLPRWLKIRVRKLQKERTTVILPKRPLKTTEDKEETIQKLETLEKKEEEVTSEEDEEKEEEEEEYDEEEHEEETDYIMSYFDNGEDFGG